MTRDRRRPIDEAPEVERIEGRVQVPFDPAEESFSNFRSKFGSDGVIVKIYRRTPNGTQFCFQGLPSEIDEEMIRAYHAKQPYASEVGNYFARPFVNGEPRDASIFISIAPQIGAPGSADHGGMAPNNGGGRIEAALDRIITRLENVERSDREPLSSLADAMAKLHGLMPKAESSTDQLLKAIELGKALASGNPADSDDWKPLIKELLTGAAPLISGLASAYMQRSAAPGPPVVQAQPEDTAVQILNDQQRMFALIQYLKAKCLKGSDPLLYVDLLMNDADEPDNQKLIHAIVTRDFSSFVQVDAEIGRPPFLAWFKSIYDGLRSQVEAANKMATNPVQPGGDESNAAKNGKSGKGSGGNKKR